jgi:hypothetical protein
MTRITSSRPSGSVAAGRRGGVDGSRAVVAEAGAGPGAGAQGGGKAGKEGLRFVCGSEGDNSSMPGSDLLSGLPGLSGRARAREQTGPERTRAHAPGDLAARLRRLGTRFEIDRIRCGQLDVTALGGLVYGRLVGSHGPQHGRVDPGAAG